MEPGVLRPIALLIACATQLVAACGSTTELSHDTTSKEVVSSSTTNSPESQSSTIEPPEATSDLANSVWAGLKSAGSSTTQGGFTVSRTSIDPSAPADPRVGISNPRYLTTAEGVVLTGEEAVVFDCRTDRLRVEGPEEAALELASALSDLAGCSSLGIGAPTACLGDPLDPAACQETGEGER